ncbi:unnamed protein product [Adineta ricciae]|uniref:Uncharacterized protein n=1 Tax=Adineta ricciae TaxID=249248 RepID=A0A813YQK3_ADIRI|nr:unnamed protein product [Adineta ricciae]CAF0887690.1 unnamed protein product [Adineta ricciae]
MFNYLLVVFIHLTFSVLFHCLHIQAYEFKSNVTDCAEDCLTDNLYVSYAYDSSNHSYVIWFTVESCWHRTPNFFRFILRAIDILSHATVNSKPIANFTEITDRNNSIRILNLQSGIYEICIEFELYKTKWIYQPRNACVVIQSRDLLHESYRQDPTSLMIALASGVVLFFILGLVVQRAKVKRKRRDDNQDDNPRARSSSVLSMTSIKQHRDRLVRNLFRRHIEQPRMSAIRQWAHDRAFRYRVSTRDHRAQKPRRLQQWKNNLIRSREHSFEQRSRAATDSSDIIPSSELTITVDPVYTISERTQNQPLSRRTSHHLLPPLERYRMA